MGRERATQDQQELCPGHYKGGAGERGMGGLVEGGGKGRGDVRWAFTSSGFPCVGVRLIYPSLRSTATFVICFHWSLLLAFSLHLSSSSAFLRSVFTQSSHFRCGLPRFLEPSSFFVSALFGSLSSFIRTMCPAHFIRLLTIRKINKSYPLVTTKRGYVGRGLVKRGWEGEERATKDQ